MIRFVCDIKGLGAIWSAAITEGWSLRVVYWFVPSRGDGGEAAREAA